MAVTRLIHHNFSQPVIETRAPALLFKLKLFSENPSKSLLSNKEVSSHYRIVWVTLSM